MMGHRETLKTSEEYDLIIFGDYKYLKRASHKIKKGMSRRNRRATRKSIAIV